MASAYYRPKTRRLQAIIVALTSSGFFLLRPVAAAENEMLARLGDEGVHAGRRDQRRKVWRCGEARRRGDILASVRGAEIADLWACRRKRRWRPASHADESARRFHQSIARRSPLARRTPGRSHPDHRVARRPRGQERALADAVPRVISPVLAKAAMEGRLPRGFSVKRLTDLPMLWSEQWRAVGLQEPIQVSAEPSWSGPNCYPLAANPSSALNLANAKPRLRPLHLGGPGNGI